MNDIFPSKVFVENAAPKARHMKARGKCEARRPWYTNQTPPSPERGVIPRVYFGPSGLNGAYCINQGPTRFALASGFHISAPLARITYTSDC
jgi:hypothetical protein